jgi:putative chitinase
VLVINRAQLDHHWPKASDALRDGIIANQAEAYTLADLTTPRRLAHFWAQVSHESGGGATLEENLNYSAKRMMQVWPSRFHTELEAQPFAHNAKALGIKVYGGRLGNRAAPSTDGYDYRGRGGLQITGQDNYRAIGLICGLDLVAHPELTIAPDGFLMVACAVWKSHGCNPFASADDLRGVTRKINGGLIGLDSRAAWLRKWKEQFDL